ncbi:hypothetical protein Bca52824_064158 [Brassica carinata]|uniref:Uncharacterized protein n=1 Tax=Brassica carinata TaxID=52824 RepID=A0A8X7QGY0_BRACI|nr:hypothetical protein Bca52824_064158 [Brassica carinata]
MLRNNDISVAELTSEKLIFDSRNRFKRGPSVVRPIERSRRRGTFSRKLGKLKTWVVVVVLIRKGTSHSAGVKPMRMHEETSSRRKTDEDVQEGAVPAYLLDRENTSRTKH